jgi:hypothetical protein
MKKTVKRDVQLVKKETIRHIEAFEMYYNMGDTRSLQRLSDVLGLSLASTLKWSRSFGWVARIVERDKRLKISNAKAYEKLSDRLAIANLNKTMNMIEKCINIFDTNIELGNVDVNTIKDLTNLAETQVKIFNLIVGDKEEVGDISEVAKESADRFRKSLFSIDSGDEEEYENDEDFEEEVYDDEDDAE